jgi:glutamyl-tRNA reductase
VAATLDAAGSGCPGPVEPPALLVLVSRYRYLDADSIARLQSAAPLITHDLPGRSRAISGCIVLSTCNRFEIYCEIAPAREASKACAEALEAVSSCSRLPLQILRALFECRIGPAVAEHLFGVACGLDSLVIGEREIAGQIRRALAAAQAAGTATGPLIRLLQGALRTAKDVGARARLGGAGTSVASVAVNLAVSRLSPLMLSDLSVVVIGSGSYAACIMSLLSRGRCSNVTVFSRSGRTAAFAAAHPVAAVTEAELQAAIGRANVVIGCSGSGSRIGTSMMARQQKDPKPLVALDLAPNRDFDPDVGELPGVDLITLESVRLAAPPTDSAQIQLARTLIRDSACRFHEQESLRTIDAAVIALRHHLHQALEREMENARKRNGASAASEETARVLRRFVRQVLHTPSVRAREMAAAGRHDEYTAALETLFGISVNVAQPAGVPNVLDQ